MKKISISVLVLTLLLVIISCGKTSVKESDLPTGAIEGTWVHTENYVSPGSIWHWVKVEDGGIITIDADNKYQVIKASPEGRLPFAIMGKSGKIGSVFTKNYNRVMCYILPDNTKDTSFIWTIPSKKDTLDISFPCFEGCTYRFLRK